MKDTGERRHRPSLFWFELMVTCCYQQYHRQLASSCVVVAVAVAVAVSVSILAGCKDSGQRLRAPARRSIHGFGGCKRRPDVKIDPIPK
jgi:hypothetical protein